MPENPLAQRPLRILVSAGEASGDLYAAELVNALRSYFPDAVFFGCAGHRMQAAGVEPVVDAASLAVVGIVEVVAHIPRIYGEFRKLIRAAKDRRPDLAILTDSPDFHLRVAEKLHAQGVPVVYLIAPQAWAWRKGRVKQMRRDLRRLLCIFPFEEAFFRDHGIDARYIGHPLTRVVKPAQTRAAFFAAHALDPARPLITILPGSRVGEIGRHMPVLVETVRRLAAQSTAQFVLALPKGLAERHGGAFFTEPISGLPIQVIEGETWDAIAHATLALAASGTVTVEAAILGTPMVTFYKVKRSSWLLGRHLVDVPFFTMVNLIAGRRVVPELIQNEMSAVNLAREALLLLNAESARNEMQAGLAGVRRLLATGENPMERAAALVVETLNSVRRTAGERNGKDVATHAS
jgi:lipid-A-disaccharide synthase